ncbi:MAG: hypothetical protein H7255_10250 [Ramlibacter sp.]|nr:hypothetical protein [Ramlibacter sp.]
MSKTLELIIDEATPGLFSWTVVRQIETGVKPLVVDFAMGPLPSRKAALEAGNACLIRNQSGTWGAPLSWGGQFAETLPMDL